MSLVLFALGFIGILVTSWFYAVMKNTGGLTVMFVVCIAAEVLFCWCAIYFAPLL